MKKIVVLFIGILIILLITKCLIVNNDDKYINNIENKVLKNTDITNIKYVNYYDNYYIVKDNSDLYLFDDKFNLILCINLNLLFNNPQNYDIVYKNKTLMYMDNYKDKEGLIFKYYDIYTGECIDEIIVGGFDE